jgi:hypothetical protein
MWLRALAVGLVTASVAVPAATASDRIAMGVSGVSLKISANSRRAVVTYQSRNRTWVVTASGAINARWPTKVRDQVHFRLRYSLRAAKVPGYCGAYDGPALPWVVAACKAPDGSYWVAQAWQRFLPNHGVAPLGEDAGRELRLSHWFGAMPEFRVAQDWAYGGRFDHLYGSVTYLGQGMHGFATTRYGAPLDRYGTLIYVDTLDSAYGPGWRRESAFVTHNPTGIFCYGFFPHGPYPSGKGRAYRATMIGPGVFPDQMWQAPEHPYDPSADAEANAEQRRAFSDHRCRPN